MCIKEGLNHNGVGPPGIDFNLLYSCDNIVCGRGFWSPIGRASLDGEKGDIIPTSDGDGTLQCRPCFDDQAMLYMGRVQCTDMVIGGFHIREVDIDSGLFKIIVAIPVLVFLAAFSCMGLRRRKSLVVSSDDRRLTRQASSMAIIRQRSSSFGPSSADGLSGEAEFEDYYSDDDWTAADSEGESKRGYRDSNPMIELAPQLSEIEETPSRASSENGSLI